MKWISSVLAVICLAGCSAIMPLQIEANIEVTQGPKETALSVNVLKDGAAFGGEEIKEVYFEVWPTNNDKAIQQYETVQKAVGTYETTAVLKPGDYFVIAHIEVEGQHVMDEEEIHID